MDMCSHWLIPVQGLLENLRNTMVFTHTSHTYIYIYLFIEISSLKCSLHSRYPPDVANMIHAIDIVQQDDMMDDHPTSWVPWMPSDFQAHQLGDGAAFGHSMYHCDALQKQAMAPVTIGLNIYLTQVRQQKRRTFLLM